MKTLNGLLKLDGWSNLHYNITFLQWPKYLNFHIFTNPPLKMSKLRNSFLWLIHYKSHPNLFLSLANCYAFSRLLLLNSNLINNCGFKKPQRYITWSSLGLGCQMWTMLDNYIAHLGSIMYKLERRKTPYNTVFWTSKSVLC